jgi:uncharacterized protein (DUF2147 family)
MILLSALLLAASHHAPPPEGSNILGTWWNSDGSVSVEVAPCGQFLCGTVTHAERRAEEDARKAGVMHMMGLRVMREFQTAGGGRWKGHVFVPAKNETYRSTITPLSADHMKVEGCVLAILCESEIWRRNR